MPHIGHTIPSAGGGATLPIAESDVTNLTTDLAAKASALVASQSISGTATLVDGSAKMVLTDTTSAAFTLTLPAAPSSGSVFIILDSLGTWNTNNLTVARNGKLIDGVASNAAHVTQYGIVEYLYDGTGWRSKIRQLSQANPVIDGTAAPGTSLKVSREDHVHPTDTSRAALASPTFTGTVVLPEGNDAAAGTASRRTLGTGATQAMQGSLAAPLASPTFTGTPAAPTAAQGTNTTQVATTAMVHSEAVLLAPLASPTFTGSPVLPTGTTGVTQSINDGSTALATDLYVDKSLNGAWAFPTGGVAATFDRTQAPQATRTVVTAAIYMTAIFIPKGVVVSNFNAISAATSASGTHCWFALFNNSRVQLATTADDTSAAAFTADTTKTQAVATIASGASSTFTTTYSGLHYVGLCAVFTGTAPTIRCDASGNTILNGLAPIVTGTSNTSQTTPNAFAFTATALTASSNRDYIWLT